MYYPWGDLPIEKIHRPETKRKVYLFSLVIQLNLLERIGIGISSDMRIFDFPMDLHGFINGNCLM